MPLPGRAEPPPQPPLHPAHPPRRPSTPQPQLNAKGMTACQLPADKEAKHAKERSVLTCKLAHVVPCLLLPDLLSAVLSDLTSNLAVAFPVLSTGTQYTTHTHHHQDLFCASDAGVVVLSRETFPLPPIALRRAQWALCGPGIKGAVQSESANYEIDLLRQSDAEPYSKEAV